MTIRHRIRPVSQLAPAVGMAALAGLAIAGMNLLTRALTSLVALRSERTPDPMPRIRWY